MELSVEQLISFIPHNLETFTVTISDEVYKALRDPASRRATERKFQAFRIKPNRGVDGLIATVDAYHEEGTHAVNVLEQGLAAVIGAAPTPPWTLSSQDMTEVVVKYDIIRAQTVLVTEELIRDLHDALGTQIIHVGAGYHNRHEHAPAAVLFHGYLECVALAWQVVNRVVKTRDKQCNGQAVGRIILHHQGVPKHPRDLPLGPIWVDPSRFSVRPGAPPHWVEFKTTPTAPPHLPPPFTPPYGLMPPPPPFHLPPYGPPLLPPPFTPLYGSMPPTPAFYPPPPTPLPPPSTLPYGYPTGGWHAASAVGPGSEGPQRLEEVETRKPAEKRKELEPVPMDDQPEGQSQPASSKVCKMGGLEAGIAGVDLNKLTPQEGGDTDTTHVTSSLLAPSSPPKTGLDLVMRTFRPPDSPSHKAARPNTQGPHAGASVLDMPMARTQTRWYQTTSLPQATNGGVSGGPIVKAEAAPVDGTPEITKPPSTASEEETMAREGGGAGHEETQEQGGHVPPPPAPQVPAPPAENGVVVRPITRGAHTEANPFAITERVDGASGPYTLAYRYLSDKVVDRTRGELAFRQATEKGQVSARSDQLQVYGLAGRGIKEAGLVALSHTRANQGWLAQRYKRLKLYPRGRIGLDYVMGHDDLINWNDGISAGAAYVVHIAGLFAGRTCARNVHVTGCATISGRMLPVNGYEYKLQAAATEGAKSGQLGRAHAIVPAESLQGGTLMDNIRSGSWEEVRLPAEDAEALRLLAAADLFELVELCLSDDESDGGAPPVPRPLHVPGLIVVQALVSTGPGRPWYCLHVEVFLYPGNGQLIVTGGSEHTYEAAVRYGVETIGVCCEDWKHEDPQLTLRMLPRNTEYDLHVNIFSSEGCPETAPQLSLATAAGLFTLLVGKPLQRNTAVAATCNLDGYLSGYPMDDQMLLAAKRNGIEHIILYSEAKAATVDYMEKCPHPEKASVTLHYLRHASDLWPFVAACGDPHVRLPDLEAKEFEVVEGGELYFVGDEEEAAAADGEEREVGGEQEEGAAADGEEREVGGEQEEGTAARAESEP